MQFFFTLETGKRYLFVKILNFSCFCGRMCSSKTKGELKMSKQLIYSGKAKDIYTTEDENLIISTYKDQATAFNGVKKEQIAGKGSVK